MLIFPSSTLPNEFIHMNDSGDSDKHSELGKDQATVSSYERLKRAIKVHRNDRLSSNQPKLRSSEL